MSLGVDAQPHAEAELRVVLEQGVRPGGTASVGAGRPRGRGQVAAVDRRASGGVGNQQPIAHELGEELQVRRLPAPGARARELEARRQLLRPLDRLGADRGGIGIGDRQEEVPGGALVVEVVELRAHVDRLVLDLLLAAGGADIDADPAARAIVGGHLDRHPSSRALAVLPLLVLERLRGTLGLGRLVDLHADRGMRAHEGALRAVDADRRIPDRDLPRDRPPLPPRRIGREGAVDRERAHREQVALARDHPGGHALHEVGGRRGHGGHHRRSLTEVVRHGHLVEGLERGVDGREVPGEHGLAQPTVGLDDRVLDRRDRILHRHHVGEREEAGLQHGVHPRPEAGILRDPVAVDDEQPQPSFNDVASRLFRQVLPDLVGAERAVQQERRAGRRDLEHVDALESLELVARDEARPADQVAGSDRLGPEAQVRDRDRAGLLRVVDEVALRVQVGAFPDDLDRVLVRTHGAVAPEPVEDGSHGLVVLGVEGRVERQARAADVVDDADGEVRRGLGVVERVERGFGHRRSELLRGQPVAPAEHARHAAGEPRPSGADLLGEGGHDVLVQRFARGPGFLRPVEHGDRSRRLGQRGDQRPGGERTEQAHLHEADTLPAGDHAPPRLPRRRRIPTPSAPAPVRPPGDRCSRTGDTDARCARRAGPSWPAPRRAPPGGTGSPLHGPGRRRRGSARNLAGRGAPVRAPCPGVRVRAGRRPSRAGPRRRAPRSSRPRARYGTRRRSAGTAPGSRAWRCGLRVRGPGPPAPTRRRASRTRSTAPPSRRSDRRRSRARAWPACAPPRASRTA